MLKISFTTVLSTVFLLLTITNANAAPPVKDLPFAQEYHEAYPLNGTAANDVRAITVDPVGKVYTATKGGLFILQDGVWRRNEQVTKGPLYDLYLDDANVLWIGAWDGLYRIAQDQIEKVPQIDDAVSVIAGRPGRIVALGPDKAWQCDDGNWKSIKRQWSGNIRDAVFAGDDDLWIATGMGLFRKQGEQIQYYYQEQELYSSELTALVVRPDNRLWIGEFGGMDVYENGVRIKTINQDDGLPNFDVHALANGPDGRIWIGTALGVVRYDGNNWSLRHSKRWLLSDDVRDIAFDRDGAAWIATVAGVSAIKSRMMTLQDKAEYYLEICQKRHIRKPWFVEKCRFPDPADHSIYEALDDDNDGSYTGAYMVMESLRYAVTKDPQAKINADKAFDAIEMLQTITETKGFVARTIIPSDWKKMADPNRTYTAQQAVEGRVRDPRYKPVEIRWRPSSDGKWLWKGDTSSDEITGHMFSYLFYYDLAADKERKQRVEKLVAKIMDYIIEGGYVLLDTDGKHTRWGVWSPEKLNHDPDWRVEAPINAFEILSYLKTALHITGDQKYQQKYLKLINQHGYLEKARRPKSYGRADRTHIDDELMAYAAPALMLYEDDPAIRSVLMEGYTWAYRTVDNEHNPFFNFMFGLVGGENFHLDQSIEFLRDQPLDLVQWRIDSSKREDIRTTRFPMFEPMQVDRMTPPSERGVMRWDKNPWSTVSGDFNDDAGHLESNGVFWMLPYWMGRYYGFIQAP